MITATILPPPVQMMEVARQNFEFKKITQRTIAEIHEKMKIDKNNNELKFSRRKYKRLSVRITDMFTQKENFYKFIARNHIYIKTPNL